MPVYPTHFTLTARKGLRGVEMREWGSITFSRISPAFAEKLWLGGFPYLHITAEGAKHYFAEATLEERKQLLELCRTPAEVLAIRDIKPGKAIDKAAQARIAFLEDGAPAPAPASAPEAEPPATEAPAPAPAPTEQT